ncbi:LPD38 domain-containing protein [uncultured Pseudoalteromonas sp.]|uniref:LPD38 domain-containing protein n=1 Tax=uncultured Pseudoalteromonas sp. TaxID=114053 RepID=UPI00259A5660|nr:LPD38 domain-containing protein [uncultured Pseudoalteromonas sp.]
MRGGVEIDVYDVNQIRTDQKNAVDNGFGIYITEHPQTADVYAKKSKGSVQKLNITAPKDSLLNRDKALSEQSDYIKSLLDKEGLLKGNEDKNGSWLYDHVKPTGAVTLSRHSGAMKSKEASKTLLGMGIRGMTYSSNHGAGNGTHHVLFSGSDIKNSTAKEAESKVSQEKEREFTQQEQSVMDEWLAAYEEAQQEGEALTLNVDAAPGKDEDDKNIAVNDKVNGVQVIDTPISELSLSKDIPQFKSGSNSDGVVEPLTGKFDPVGMSPVQVWVRENGNKEIITGRHRFDLAKRDGVKNIPAQYHYESDGFTADDGKRLDAILNIREDKGQVEDYVELFKQDGITEAEAKQYGLLDRATGRTAFKIANSATNETIEAQRTGRISAQAAEAIAEAAPGNERLQILGVKSIADDQRSITFAKNLIHAVSALNTNQDQGGQSGDLFGFDDSAMQEAEQMAKVAAAKQREIRSRLSAIRGAASKPEIAAAEGVNVKDPKALKERTNELANEVKAWDSWHTNPSMVQQIRDSISAPNTETSAPNTAPITETVAEPEATEQDSGPDLFGDSEPPLFNQDPTAQSNKPEIPDSSDKPKPQSKLDNAANEISDKKREAVERLKKLINSRKGQFNSGIDPEVMVAVAEVGALSIAEGAVKFAQWARDVLNTTRAVGIKDEDVKPFLKEAYGAMSANPERYNIDENTADSMDLPRSVRKFDISTIESESNVPTTGENLEQNSQGTDQKSKPENINDDESDGSKQSNGPSKSDTKQEQRSDSEPSLSANDGALLGERSVDDLFNESGNVKGTANTGSAGNDGRSNSDNDARAQAEHGPATATNEATERLATDLQAEQTAAKKSHNAKWGNESDILKSVPVLMPEQAGDIAKIENRFFGAENPGPGYQNTNGTGTGKTFVGLGVLKRFEQTGKTNALVAVPNDGIAQQWVQAAKEHFGLDVYLIGSDGGAKAKDAGRGITITTYATLGSNDRLIRDRKAFDIIIADESQNLMGSQQAKVTNALDSLRALTNHEAGSNRRAKAYLTDEIEALDKKIKVKAKRFEADGEAKPKALAEAKSFYQKDLTKLHDKIKSLASKFKEEGTTDSKVLFLSATPFPYVKNLDYAEGYLFNYTDYGDKFEGGYDNAFTGRNAFYIQNFGYRWRYHKLNTPGADVDQSLMERQFHETMKEKGVLGGRTLEVEADYRRDFIKVETAAGEKLDDLIEKWRDHSVGGEAEGETSERPYSELADILNKTFDYTQKIKLTEAIKAEEAVNRVKEHVKKGRKVVLFHSYNVGGSFDPIEKVRQLKPELIAQFESEFPGMTNIDFGVLARPLDLFADEFGNSVRFYNGNVPDKARKEAKDLFNKDNSGVDIIVVQQEAGEAGISLHDITGGKQRVLINIGMPVKPTQFIQIEGRIYRVGVKTDAQFENLTTGTAFERNIFASKIAGRASTAENLAMGEFARSLKESISEGYLDAAYLPVNEDIGKGGKVSDRPTEINDWDRAKSFYYANLKRNAGTKSAEGDDYFATPEPLGKKMVEWLQPSPGNRLLEPSVGHAAIGRWFPGTTRNKATEKSFKLTSLAQMNFPGEVDNIPFEDLNVINKFEGIPMNPPFGKGGKLAYDHIRKAITHLVNGGRIVALVPDGPAANKRLDALLTDEKLTNIYQAAEIDLPAGVFDRAGTGVKTKIIVLDRFDNETDAPAMQRISFTGAKDINELFERIKDVELKQRNQPTAKVYDIDQYMDASSEPTTNRNGESVFKVQLYGFLPTDVKSVIDKEAASEFGAIPTRDEQVYTLDNDEARQDFANFIAQTIEEAKESGIEFNFSPPKKKMRVEGQQSNEHFDATGETYTTKRGKEFLVTEMKNRQEREVYSALKELAKEFGGWARGQKFMFSNLDDMTQFNAQAKSVISGDNDIKFSKSKVKQNAKGVKADKAQEIANNFIKGLNGANGITVNILEDTASAEKLWRMSLDGATVKGAYSEMSNTVYIIAENMDSIDDLKQTLAHETIAHGGLDTVIGKEAKQEFIDRIKKTKGRKAFEKYWKDANNDYWDASEDVKAEEIFARFVENEPSKGEVKYWWNALKRFVRKQLDRLGIVYREDDELTAMREMLESIVKGFKAQREPMVNNQAEMAYSQSDKKFSRTADNDTRTAKQKLGLEEQAAKTFSDMAKDKVNETVDTLKSSPFWNRLNEGIFDGLSGIKNAEIAAGVTDPNRQGYVSARLASGLADVLHGVFNYGAPQWRDGIVQRKEGTKGLLEVFGMVGDDLNNWLAWMGAHRAEQLKAQGRENNLTDNDIAELKALANGKERLFEQTRLEYNKINSAILDMAQQAGLLSEAQRSGFDEEYYVPFFRDMGETDPEMDEIKRMIVEPHTRKGISGQSAQLKTLKGGTQSTKDLLENIIGRQSTLIDASLKNKAMQEVVRNLDGTDYMTHENSDIAKSMTQQQLNNDGKVRVMIDGKPQAYLVSDPALLRALIQVNDVGSQSLFNKLGRSAKRFLTAGITLSPDFIFKNFVRDAAHAWMINKDDFKFGTDSIKGLKKAFKEDEAYRDLIFSGAAFQGGYIHGADPEAGAQQIRRALRSKGLTSKEVEGYMATVVTSGATLLEKYRGISDKVENANRLSTYETAIAAGKSKRQAAYEAKDLMDYSLKGNFKLIGTMIDTLPFFNARLQGMSKLVRAAKASNDDRVLRVLSANLAMKGIKVAAFSLALAAMNDDDEDYQELPDWDKDMNWHIFADGEHIRIPKPFELGIIFGTLPERMFHYGTGTQTEKDLGKSVANAVWNTMSMNPIPQMFLPATEIMINKSFFKGSPIEGMADQNKQAEDRYNAYTSDTAKAIAQQFGVSPKKVEHLIKGYTGTIGGYVLGASDILARMMTGKVSPDTPVSRYPVVKAFYQGSGPKTNTKFSNDFYEALDAANQAYGSYKRAMELGDTTRQQELIEKDGQKLRSKATLAKVQRMISKLRKMQKAINDNDKLDGKQKREKLDDVQRKINAIYHKAYVTLNLGEW